MKFNGGKIKYTTKPLSNVLNLIVLLFYLEIA